MALCQEKEAEQITATETPTNQKMRNELHGGGAPRTSVNGLAPR